jgi:hypothetical protein
MRNALLIVHTMVAITTATIFLFQMATLVYPIRASFGERSREEDVHAEHKQEGSGSKGQVCGELRE